MPDCFCIAAIDNELASFMDYADTFGCQQEFLYKNLRITLLYLACFKLTN